MIVAVERGGVERRRGGEKGGIIKMQMGDGRGRR